MKIKHKITTRQVGGKPVENVYRNLLKQTVKIVLEREAVSLPCVVNVLITDDVGIRAYNREHRGIDEATDVLSFPMQDFTSSGWDGLENPDIDMDTQTLPLGDIVISLQTIKRNARRYRRTFEQESTFMIIHSALHLLGYDHGDAMQDKENILMQDMGYLYFDR